MNLATKKKAAAWLPPVQPYSVNRLPQAPPKVYHDRSVKCLGCPYPKHGLICHGGDDGSCLRTDMQELDAKNILKKEDKLHV